MPVSFSRPLPRHTRAGSSDLDTTDIANNTNGTGLAGISEADYFQARADSMQPDNTSSRGKTSQPPMSPFSELSSTTSTPRFELDSRTISPCLTRPREFRETSATVPRYSTNGDYPEVVGGLQYPTRSTDTLENKSNHQRFESHFSGTTVTTTALSEHGQPILGEDEKETYVMPKESLAAADGRRQRSKGSNTYLEILDTDAPAPRRRYICGLRRRLFIAIVSVSTVIIAAIAVGAGIASLHSQHSRQSRPTGANPLYSIGGALDTGFYSTSGAFNGSGLAIASVNFGIDDSIYVFYQKFNGDIDQLLYSATGQWTFVTTVATDAKNSTPLSTVAYIVDNVATWHLFYIDNTQKVRQRTQSNGSAYQTNIWANGTLNTLNLQAYRGDMVGLQACYWGNYYGSSTTWGDGFNVSTTNPATGMNLWYAADNSTFEQWDYTHGQTGWTHSKTWQNLNGHAGVGCQSWLSGTTSYVFFVNLENTIDIYWRDTDVNKTSSDTHPINTWIQSNVSIPNVHPSTSLGYTDFLDYQGADFSMRGANITWAAENTTIATKIGKGTLQNTMQPDTWVADKGLPGTHMSCTGLDPVSGGRSEIVLYQQIGNDIRIGRRDALAGDFTYAQVPLGSVSS